MANVHVSRPFLRPFSIQMKWQNVDCNHFRRSTQIRKYLHPELVYLSETTNVSLLSNIKLVIWYISEIAAIFVNKSNRRTIYDLLFDEDVKSETYLAFYTVHFISGIEFLTAWMAEQNKKSILLLRLQYFLFSKIQLNSKIENSGIANTRGYLD